MTSVKIKICGLSQIADIDAANALALDMVGFVFHKASPRHVSHEQAARLSARLNPEIERVALLVDPDDEAIAAACAAISPHRLQLHGQETPQRVAAIKKQHHAAIIKALPIASADDVSAAQNYEGIADWFMFDSKPQSGENEGGNARPFDWHLLAAYTSQTPWLLAGGLTPSNVASAIRISQARMVDVSSGVEATRGKKECAHMADFVAAVRTKF